MNEKIIIIRGIFVNYFHLILSFLSILLITPIIIDNLGMSSYGLWVIFSSILLIFNMFDFGMNTSIAKYTAELKAKKKHKKLDQIVSTTIVFFFLVGLIIFSLSLISSKFIPGLFSVEKKMENTVIIVFLIVIFNFVLNLVGGVFGNIIYGSQRVDIWKGLAIIQVIVNFLLSILFLHLGYGLIGLASAATISISVVLAIYLSLLFFNFYKINISIKNINVSVFKEILPFSLRTFFLGITNRLNYHTDYLIIGIILGSYEVSAYEISYKLIFITSYLFSVISTSMLPKFTSLYSNKNFTMLKFLYTKVIKLSYIIMMPTLISLFFFGELLIGIWVGNDKFVGIEIFAIFICLILFHITGTLATTMLLATGHNKELLRVDILQSLINVGLSLILIQHFGIMGVALGTFFGQVIAPLWYVPYLSCKFINFSFIDYLKSSIMPPFLIGIVVFIILFSLDINRYFSGLFEIIFGCSLIYLFYFSISYLLIINKDDIQSMKRLFLKNYNR